MDTQTINSFFDELEKVSKEKKEKSRLAKALVPAALITAGSVGAGMLFKRLKRGQYGPTQTLHRMSKIRQGMTKAGESKQDIPDNLITKDRFKRFLGAAVPGAVGTGIGYGAARYLGAPMEKKLLRLGLRRGPAKVLRYALPTAAGLGAGLSLARLNVRDKLFKKVRGGDTKRDSRSKQQSGQLG
jgi:hypothetical protein